MASRIRLGIVCVGVTLAAVTGHVAARQQPPERFGPPRPDFDIRDSRPPVPGSVTAQAELQQQAGPRGRRGSRLNPFTGALRVLDRPGWAAGHTAPHAALRNRLTRSVERLGLDDGDLESLTVVRDYVSRSNGVRHVTFAQAFDDIRVFDGTVTVHIAQSGEIVRVTSGAGHGEGRRSSRRLTAEDAAMAAARDISPDTVFVPERAAPSGRGPGQLAGGDTVVRLARGGFRRDVMAALVWFPMDGALRLAWHVELEPEGVPQYYDVLIDAETGELLLRSNRVLDAAGSGRVIQSAATQAIDPRLSDPMPMGAGACPPPSNHELRDLTGPFRDSPTVLFDTGRLSGNNVHVFRGDSSTEGALGSFDGTRWLFDFSFNSADSAETAFFFSLNFAHDFFYDLGFDEAAGNFQVDNFSRGGAGGDPIQGWARAAGRNNATFQIAPEGSSPIIRMYLWDGSGCWSDDVDGDGVEDLDGDYDTDIILHEFHHGVSHRLNTSFRGNEAGAIGEGGSDFFAYSINGDTLLAEYSRPGGLRGVNNKTYNDWTCQLGFFCEVHDNGEIWANVLWDIRERFRTDLVRGSGAAAINESHQLYIDGLKLSPPLPTMLDLRDAMLQADVLRNPGSPDSANFCALWESFAARGMGLNATDTADNGANRVGASFAVPEGCIAPPGLPAVTLAVSDATATEASTTTGVYTISREAASDAPMIVNFTVAGTAAKGTDYVALPAAATIPAGALSVDVPLVPIDDAVLEPNETVILTLRSGSGYVVGTPAAGTVTIVSDDVAPDFTVAALTVPAAGGAGLTVSVTDRTLNQGTGASGLSTTSFYLSANTVLDTGDELMGTREVPALGVGASSTATTTVTIPAAAGAGTYWIIAKADGPGAISEATETNNTRLALIRIGPDLAVTALSAPATAEPGTTIAATETTTNQGAGGASGSSTRFYLSANYVLDATDTPLEARSVGPLAPGGSSAATTLVTIPASMATGAYYLVAAADNGNAVPEATETNNTRFFSLRIGADLFVSTLTAPTRAASGTIISVTETTKNIGAGGAGPSTTAFYLSSNLTLDAGDPRLTGERAVGPLATGASSLGTTQVTLPQVAPGTWNLIANADDGRTVVETQETNNIRYTTIYIGPDLSVSAINAPSSAVAGTTITITETTRNLGLDIAAPSTTRFYLSLNGALDATDLPLNGERGLPALGANATNSGSTTVTIPTGISGSYFLLAVADGYGAVAESSEVNNVGLRLITINP